MHDVDRIINLAAHTLCFAVVVAHTAADNGKGVVLLDEFEFFLELPLSNERHIALDTDVCGTIGFTRSSAELVDGKATGYRLRKVAVYSLSFA